MHRHTHKTITSYSPNRLKKALQILYPILGAALLPWLLLVLLVAVVGLL